MSNPMLFRALCGTALAFGSSFMVTAPAAAADSIIYHDGETSKLQDLFRGLSMGVPVYGNDPYYGAYAKDLAPKDFAASYDSYIGKSLSLTGNIVTLESGTVSSVFGAINNYDSAGVSGNDVVINGGTVSRVFGGSAGNWYYFGTPVSAFSATVSGNRATITNGTVDNVYGGYADGVGIGSTALVKDNTVTIDGGSVRSVYGGSVGSGATVGQGDSTVSGNSVTLNNGTVSGSVYGGEHITTTDLASTNTATGNSVFINGGTVNGNVFGGYLFGMSNATVAGNSVTISDGEVKTGIIGGNVEFTGTSVTSNSEVTATNNNVTISGGAALGVIGGWAFMDDSRSGAATASGNTVDVSDGTVSVVTGGDASSSFGDATASDNSVTISGGEASGVIGGQATGLSSGDATVSDNSVTISGGEIILSVIGGQATSETGGASSSGNIVDISDGTVGGVIGGMAGSNDDGTATASDNSVTISGGEVFFGATGGTAHSNSGDATASDNIVTINDGTVDNDVYGGQASFFSSGSATASDNTVAISVGEVKGNVYGGQALSFTDGIATASGNSVTISGGTVGDNDDPYTGNVYGGEAITVNSGTATASDNSVTISDGEVNGDAVGGFAYSGDAGTAIASGNSVTISGGTVNGDVYGGYAESFSAIATSTNNSVDISDGEVKGNVYGGYVDSLLGDATNNTVTISGSPTFGSGTILYGGYGTGTGDVFTGNTLNLHSAGLTVAGLQNFQYLNFYLPTTLGDGGTMLFVTGVADITGSTVNVGIDGASSPLDVGDKVILIDAAMLTGIPVNTTANGTGMLGVTLLYDFDITTLGNQLLATVAGGGGPPSGPGSCTGHGESVTCPGASLQTVNAVADSLAPSDSDIGKSKCLSGNTVTVESGGAVGGDVYGAINLNDADAITNNQVFINGGAVSGNIYGGYAGPGTVTNNTVTISGSPTFGAGTLLYGGSSTGAGDVFTDNTLNKNSAVSVSDVLNFEFVSFGYSGDANIGTLDTTPTGSTQPGVVLNTNTNTINFGGNITGSGSLTKTGAGTLTLSGTNTYSGGTLVSAGTLAGNTDSLQGDIANNALVAFNQTTGGTYSGVMSGSGSLTKTGTGTLTLTGANTYGGGTTVNGGTLAGNTTSLQGNIANNALVVFNQTTGGAYSGVMSGSGSLTKTGTGALTLTGANTYGGGTTVSDGTLAGNTISLQGNITNNAHLMFNQDSAGMYTGTISGTGDLSKDGTGAVTVAGSVNQGNVEIENGALNFAAGSSLTASGDISVASGAQLGLSANSPVVNAGTVTAAAGAILDVNGYSGEGLHTLIETTGGISGDFTLYVGGAAVPAPGLDSFMNTSLQKINMGNDLAIEQSLVWYQAIDAHGTFNIAAGNFTLADSLADNTTPGAGTTYGWDGASLTKTGAGTLTLTGTNTYSGNTTVNAGTLSIGSDGNIGGGTNTLAGGTLQLTGSAYDKAWTLGTGSNAIETAGSATLNGVLSGTGGFAKTGAGTLTLTGANTYSGGTTVNDGTLAGNTASLQGDMTNNALVAFNQTVDGIYSGTMSGSGSLTKEGTGTLTLTGANTYSGDTAVNAGTLAGNIAEGTNLTVAGGATYDSTGAAKSVNGLNGGGNVINVGGLSVQGGDFSGVISGTGGLTKAGAGTLTLSGANGYTGLTEVRAGTLALSGAGSVSDTLALYSGTTFNTGGNAVSLSRLDVRGPSAWTGDLNMADTAMNFYLPITMTAGGTMLAVSGTADITGSTVNVGIAGGSSPLQMGDQVVLIDAGTLTGAPVNDTANGTGMQGVTLLYDFDITTQGNQLLAAVTASDSGSGSGPHINPQTKALSEGVVGAVSLVNQSADLIAGKGMIQATGAAAQGAGFGAFGALTGGWSRYDTGSHVDMSSVSLMAGISRRAELQPGKLLLGAFFEYGNGSYDTYNSFSNAASVHGDGDIYHLGGGIIGRMDFTGNFYAEASARAGNVRNDYNGGDLRDFWGRSAQYESSTAYYGVHLGAGYVWNLTDKAALDLYGKYFWTHQAGDTLRLSTGDPVDFEDVDSHRLRVGTRFSYAVNQTINPYVGCAYEHEFDGKARVTTNGYAIAAPSLEGGTGIGELGLTFKPTKELPVSLDLGIQGYVGTREGVTGSLHIRYDF